MKTLSDLKRDLSKGAKVAMTYNSFGKGALLGVERYVIKQNTVGVVFNVDKNATKGSTLEYPKASLLTYDGDTFSVHEAGYRPLTAEEQRVYDNKPSYRPENQAVLEADLLGDGSQMYWADKRYLADNNMTYLDGHRENGGLYYDFNTKMIRDNSIKGEVTLTYKITK